MCQLAVKRKKEEEKEVVKRKVTKIYYESRCFMKSSFVLYKL